MARGVPWSRKDVTDTRWNTLDQLRSIAKWDMYACFQALCCRDMDPVVDNRVTEEISRKTG